MNEELVREDTQMRTIEEAIYKKVNEQFYYDELYSGVKRLKDLRKVLKNDIKELIEYEIPYFSLRPHYSDFLDRVRNQAVRDLKSTLRMYNGFIKIGNDREKEMRK